MTYIYALLCPESRAVRYIGKTKNVKTRLYFHIWKAKTSHLHNHCSNWIRSLLSRGLEPEMIVVSTVPVDEDWQSAEQAAIIEYRARGCDLTNGTAGGDGFHDMRPDVLAKRTASWRRALQDPIKRADFVRRTDACRYSPESRAKKSKSLRAAWGDAERKQNFLVGMRAPDAVARRSEATRRRMTDPLGAAEHQSRMKKLFEAPERREQIRQASAKRWSDPVATAAFAAKMKARYEDPEFEGEAGRSQR